MRLKKMKISDCDKYTLCIWKDNIWIAFQAVLDAVPDDGTKERKELEDKSDDLIEFLKNYNTLYIKLEELINPAQKSKAELTLEGEDVIPFRPLLYRDFMLCEKHIINSSREYTKRMTPKLMPLINVYEWLTNKPFPAFVPKRPWYDNPVYYKGNMLSFVGNGETITYPKYATLKDYELELGMIITKDVINATEEEGLNAIGAFCVFNDFSARNVQVDEMKKTGFGPCKAKDFASSISSVVVTADEIIPVIDSLEARVYINNKEVAHGKLDQFYHSLGKAVSYASKGEQVHAGEFMATGTIPNCCGMENNVFLECGDTIRLEIDKVGELANAISCDLI
jgi:2-keto-4-pentenoate hydratase/2-oxohepta-3-ene-1,7-dioic acid hydratase in catechol pathway